MRPDQQRVQTLLTDTVTLLCKNGLQYNKELKVQGLLGITLDDEEVFIVHINKVFDEVQGKVTSVQSESGSGPLMQVVNNLTSLNSFNQFENVDGLSFEDEDRSEHISNGMQLPVIHAQQTSILNRTNSSSASKANHRGAKRSIGAARRKDSRSVKQRLASSFRHESPNKEGHCMQLKRESGFTPEYEEIHIKDEPPDQLIITDNNEIEVDDATGTNDDVQSKNSAYNSVSSHDSYAPSHNPLVMYESLEDCDESNSPATKSQDAEGEETVDMIECLLYNERVSQQEEGSTTSGLYKNVHISGAEETGSQLDDSVSGTGCSTWEDTVEVPALATSSSKSVRIKSSPQAEETTTYHGVQRQDINETLSQHYRDLLEAAAVQGDGYPCAECDQVLKTRAIWMEHMKGVHMNRKYACQYCGETFKWRSSRKRHVLMTHRNEKDLDLAVTT